MMLPSRVVLVVMLLLFVAATKAYPDTLVDVAVNNVALGSETLSMSFELDTTTSFIVPGTTTIQFDGLLSGTQWSGDAYLPSCYPNCAPLPPVNLFSWTDASGDFFAVGVYDFSLNSGCNGVVPDGTTCPFPAVGLYPGNVVQLDCATFVDTCGIASGAGFSHGFGPGGVVISAVPEPSTPLLLGLPCLLAALLMSRLIPRAQGSTGFARALKN